MPKEPRGKLDNLSTAANGFPVCSGCGFTSHDAGVFASHDCDAGVSRLFPCRYCSHKSRNLAHLRVHERTHSAEKPFKCDQCDYAGRTPGNLKSHQRRHMPAEASDYLVCAHCDFFCPDVLTMQAHQQLHGPPGMATTPVTAMVSPASSLVALVDDDGMPPTPSDTPQSAAKREYKCRFCSHVSKDRSNIRVHERTHAPGGSGKPFGCPHCEYRSAQRVHMILHVKRRHGESAAEAVPSSSVLRMSGRPMPPPLAGPAPEPDNIDYAAVMRAEAAMGALLTIVYPMMLPADDTSATLLSLTV